MWMLYVRREYRVVGYYMLGKNMFIELSNTYAKENKSGSHMDEVSLATQDYGL